MEVFALPQPRLRVGEALRSAVRSLGSGAWPVVLVGPIALAVEIWPKSWARGYLWRDALILAYLLILAGACSVTICALRGGQAQVGRLLDGFRRASPLLGTVFLSGWPAILGALLWYVGAELLKGNYPHLFGTRTVPNPLALSMGYSAAVALVLIFILVIPRVALAVCSIVSGDEVDSRGAARATSRLMSGSRVRLALLFLILPMAFSLSDRLFPVTCLVTAPLWALIVAAIYAQLRDVQSPAGTTGQPTPA